MPDTISLPLEGGAATIHETPADALSGLAEAASAEAQVGMIARIDPALCDLCDLNPRARIPFDPATEKPLIDNIRERLQQVPVIVRPGQGAGRYDIVAGTRRYGAVRYLSLFDRDIRLLAEVRLLSDREAWVLAEAENSDRKDISEYERAKAWEKALDSLFGANQSALAKSLGVDKSVVSRMIALARLPQEIVELVTRPELLRARFAEQMSPALNDTEKRASILAYASNLAEAGQKLAPAELARRLLLSPAEAEASRPVKIAAGRQDSQAIWQRRPNGSCQLTLKPVPEELSAEERKNLLKALTAKLKEHIGRRG